MKKRNNLLVEIDNAVDLLSQLKASLIIIRGELVENAKKPEKLEEKKEEQVPLSKEEQIPLFKDLVDKNPNSKPITVHRKESGEEVIKEEEPFNKKYQIQVNGLGTVKLEN